MKPRVAALIGAGMVAKTHVAACMSSDLVALKGVAARSRESADQLAAFAQSEFAAELVSYAHINQLAQDDQVEIAIVATPPNARMDVIKPLAAAGKNIILEKPVGRNSREAAEIVEMCRSANIALGIFFQHRARQVSIQAKAMIDTGEFGKLLVAEFDVPWWREQSYYDEPGRGTYERDGGGVLISQAIHTIDLGLSLTGPVRAVNALAATSGFHEMESEDYVVAGLQFENGAIGRLTASTASFPGSTESISLYFEKARLHLEAGMLEVAHRDGTKQTYGEAAGSGGGADPMAFTHEWHQSIIENFVEHLNGKASLFATGEDALSAHRLIDAIVSSSRAGKTETLIQ